MLIRCAISLMLLAGTAAAQTAPAGLDRDCQAVHARYDRSAGPKAFAAGRTRGCGWQVRSDTASSLDAIKALAIRQCAAAGGDQCRIVASVATGSAGQLNAQGRSPNCEQAFGRYQAATGPKAFAQSGAGNCGWQIRNQQYRTIEEIQAKAVEQCRSNGGQACRVVAVQR